MCIIAEQNWAERLYLFEIFIRSEIINIQGVPQISLKKDAYEWD